MKKIGIFYLILFCLSVSACKRPNVETVNGQDTEIGIDDEMLKPGITLNAKIIKVLDGDTYDALTKDKQTIRIRMEGIDAPEGGMGFFKVSKEFLSDLCLGKTVEIKINDTDSHGRYIANTFLDDRRELSHAMLKAGLAWHYKQYNSDPELTKIEEEARINKAGLWEEDNPVPPWIHRRLRSRGNSTKDLRPYRLRKFGVSRQKDSFESDDLKLETVPVRNGTEIKIYKNGKLIQTLSLKEEGNFEISLADFDADGETDIKIGDSNAGYYFFNPAKYKFEYRPDWKIKIWKIDKPNRQLLSLPDGNPYKGKVKLYEINEDSNLVLKTELKY